MARDADRAWHFRARLDEARWWLGSAHPEAASLAEYMLDRDLWWSETKRAEPKDWSPPLWVHDISGYREWLAEKKRQTPPK